ADEATDSGFVLAATSNTTRRTSGMPARSPSTNIFMKFGAHLSEYRPGPSLVGDSKPRIDLTLLTAAVAASFTHLIPFRMPSANIFMRFLPKLRAVLARSPSSCFAVVMMFPTRFLAVDFNVSHAPFHSPFRIFNALFTIPRYESTAVLMILEIQF